MSRKPFSVVKVTVHDAQACRWISLFYDCHCDDLQFTYSLQVVLNPPNDSSNGWPPFSECILLQKAVIVFVLCLDLHVNYLRIFQYVSPRYR